MPDPQEAAARIGSASWLAGARVRKDSGRTSVLEGELDGRAVIVKTMRLRPWRDLPARLFGRTRLQRQLRGAKLLEVAEISTAAPLLLVRGKHSDQPGTVEALVLEKLDGRTLLRVIADGGLSVHEEHALAEAVGRLTASLHLCRVRNRDHKPSNIIVQRDEDGAFQLAIIDTVGIRAWSLQVGRDRMLANLVWELVGTGLLPRCALLMRVINAYANEMKPMNVGDRLHSERPGEIWHEVSNLVRDHGDCTPKDDPLAGD